MSTQQQNEKKRIQSEIQKMNTELSDLTNRSEAIKVKRNALAEMIDAKAKAIGDDLLHDRDISQSSDALARDKATIEGLDEALSQAASRIDFLNGEIIYKQKNDRLIDFYSLADEVYADFSDTLDLLHKVILNSRALEAKFEEMGKIGAAAGMRIESDDHLRITRAMLADLMGDFNTANGLPYKVQNLENSYPATLKIIREKKGK